MTYAVDLAFFLVAGVIAAGATALFAPEWVTPALAAVLAVTILTLIAETLMWRFKRHALEDNQIASVSGILAPSTRIATRVKLHSVEIAQGPFARHFGYATLHLGMAGGEMAIEGIELERALEVRARILETIAQTDFSQLESQRGRLTA